MTHLREEMGRMLLPFLNGEMTFAQSCILADQMIHLVTEAQLADARTKFLDAMGEDVDLSHLDKDDRSREESEAFERTAPKGGRHG
jgi:hypothetical protein